MDTNLEDTFINEVSELIRTYSRKISVVYKRMYGLNHDKLLKMYTKFSKHLQDFNEELLSSCQTKVDELEKKAEQKYTEYVTLVKELNMTQEFSFNSSEPLNATIEKLDALLSDLKTIQIERLDRYSALVEKEWNLCNILGEQPIVSTSAIPSENQISALQTQVENLEQKKINRSKRFCIIKESILSLIQEIEFEHTSPFHVELVNSTKGSNNLKTEYIERVQKFEEELKKEQQKAIQNIKYFKEKLNKVWDRIKVDENHRNAFLNNINGIGKSYQNMLKNELERCEEIQRANIKPVIESIRSEIQEMWDKLTYTPEQRMSFIGFMSDSFSCDLLTLHELELERLEGYYEQNKHIYELAEKRESLWKRMQHLDELESDKNRLKNRGGLLLKEEKERKILENSVPMTDAQLKIYLSQYEERIGNTFIWRGLNLLKKIADDWKSRQARKNSKKI